ncbi:hypothetical protein BMF94_1449 [Rhodotorula taiwanensis]|uniref:CobW/HypB/UreG nucleotide-binding domain-containing protein n=1 Tax=Rhodotorula taiwanensis TaxID=741276 RepID=A0A2S5BFJ3_9BASI|nr:hypothetical protein BMF94_1449 [Rhodotorula taiwanensis]
MAPTAQFIPAPALGGTTTSAPAGSHSHDHSHAHSHDHGAQEHGHTHELMEHPGKNHELMSSISRAGKFTERDMPNYSGRNWTERGFTIGIGGPVGSGKTALTLALCRYFRDTHNIAVVTNDIFTREDQEFLIRHEALSDKGRIRAIETGGCPHAAIREDISANLGALEELQAAYGCEMLFVESGGDNLAANYSRELADYIIYVMCAGFGVFPGEKIPRKGGPGVSQSDLLVINKTDLAVHVGASLEVMKRDADRMRDHGPTLFTCVKSGDGVEGVAELIQAAWTSATGGKKQ